MYATDEEKTTTVSHSENILINKPTIPLKVSCPIVAEPQVPYKCGFSSVPGSGTLDIMFDDVSSYTFDPFGKIKKLISCIFSLKLWILFKDSGESNSDPISLGTIPPRNSDMLNGSTKPLIPNSILPNTIITNSRSDSYLKLLFVEWYGQGIAEDLNIYVIRHHL